MVVLPFFIVYCNSLLFKEIYLIRKKRVNVIRGRAGQII